MEVLCRIPAGKRLDRVIEVPPTRKGNLTVLSSESVPSCFTGNEPQPATEPELTEYVARNLRETWPARRAAVSFLRSLVFEVQGGSASVPGGDRICLADQHDSPGIFCANRAHLVTKFAGRRVRVRSEIAAPADTTITLSL